MLNNFISWAICATFKALYSIPIRRSEKVLLWFNKLKCASTLKFRIHSFIELLIISERSSFICLFVKLKISLLSFKAVNVLISVDFVLFVSFNR